ncbi:ABC transporter ATP-binding protein [Streptomyces sp. NBC_00443]|uniref:ABC transporter ATP-binding protein n=1 Tax=Streptomyces sp. NBC_00443 TaxID=2975743 RepID=UPI002E2088E0
MTTTNELSTQGLRLRYGDRLVVGDLDLTLPGGAVTAIVGPNACGKSTLLRGLSRLLAPAAGSVTLDGADIHRMSARALALRMGLLPQQPVTPEAITVEALVRLGRYPHQRLLSPWSATDQKAVDEALERTGTAVLRDQPVDQLSGGQRQRAWIALALAQDTELLLLDEPTTFLDLRHQLDVLDLVAALHAEAGRTVVMVLHDLGQTPQAPNSSSLRVSGVFGIERRVQSVSDLDEVFRRELGWSPVVCACVIDEGLVQRDVVALDVVSEV